MIIRDLLYAYYSDHYWLSYVIWYIYISKYIPYSSQHPKSLLYFYIVLSIVCLSVFVCAQSCLTLCKPMDSSPPGSSLHGILQARILEWVAISFSRGSSQLRNQPMSSVSPSLQALKADSLPLSPWVVVAITVYILCVIIRKLLRIVLS